MGTIELPGEEAYTTFLIYYYSLYWIVRNNEGMGLTAITTTMV